ncbi:helix-turn-helix domain-containing protein [uncultured Croceitalea sp.]|uniref:helix-turn-helix domain-containing protein n=1 Tax=uncultured Croceitalea sp. TaxID=1798908 RepID=UPI00374E9F3A
MKNDEERQLLHSDTPFVKGDFHYAELEKGLWIMSSEMFYKNNVSFKPIYDNFLPVNYYFVSINLVENSYNKGSYEFNNFKIQNNSISFSKPRIDYINYHFKNSKEIMYIAYFDEAWLKKNIMESLVIPVSFNEFLLNKDKGFFNYSLTNKSFEPLIQKFSNLFKNSTKPNLFELKKLTYEFFTLFLLSLKKNETLNSNNLKPRDRFKIEKIEHYLLGKLHDKFPGIEHIAMKYKISPTKLKQDFKTLYDCSIFNFFQQKKMDLAYTVIKDSNLKIKEVSSKFSYENVSKFSKAFYKHHNILPSDIRKQ